MASDRAKEEGSDTNKHAGQIKLTFFRLESQQG